MNKLLMIALVASAFFALPGCRSHHHDRHPRTPPPVVHRKVPPRSGYHKVPPPIVRPAPARGVKVPPPIR